MGISLGPMASGLPKDLVQKLVDAEREPIRQLEAKKVNEKSRLKLIDDLAAKITGATAGLKDLSRYRQFRELTGAVGRPELMDVSVDGAVAETGEYSVEVIQMAGRSSMLSNGFPDPNDTYAGAGYFNYTLPDGQEREVYIDEENSTLNGIANIINKHGELNLQAIVVNDGTGSDEPYRLIVAHKGSGETNDAEYPDFYFVDGDQEFFMDQERPALNSKLKVNGFEVEFEGNSIDTLIPGVTLNLKDVAPGKEFTLGIKEDLKSSEAKVKGLVEQLNEIFSFIQNQNKLDKDSDTKSTLGGDITLQNLEFKIRNLILTPMPTESGNIRLGDMGITFNRSGLLDVNANKLTQSLTSNFHGIAQFFTGLSDANDGFVSRLQATLSSLTQNRGMVQSRSEGIKNRIKDIDRQIEIKERQVARTEENLKEKFSKLEGTIGTLKSKQASVQATLGGGSLMPSLGG